MTVPHFTNKLREVWHRPKGNDEVAGGGTTDVTGDIGVFDHIPNRLLSIKLGDIILLALVSDSIVTKGLAKKRKWTTLSTKKVDVAEMEEDDESKLLSDRGGNFGKYCVWGSEAFLLERMETCVT